LIALLTLATALAVRRRFDHYQQSAEISPVGKGEPKAPGRR